MAKRVVKAFLVLWKSGDGDGMVYGESFHWPRGSALAEVKKCKRGDPGYTAQIVPCTVTYEADWPPKRTTKGAGGGNK